MTTEMTTLDRISSDVILDKRLELHTDALLTQNAPAIVKQDTFPYYWYGGDGTDYLSNGMFGFGESAQWVNSLFSNSAISTCSDWIAEQTLQVRPVLVDEDGEEDEFILEEIANTQPLYGLNDMLAAVATDYNFWGTAYIEMLSEGGRFAGLAWRPRFRIMHVRENGVLKNYQYIDRIDGLSVGEGRDIPLSRMIVVKRFLNVNDLSQGVSVLRNMVKETYTDNEAAAFTAYILSNAQAIGLLVSPKQNNTLGGGGAPVTQETREFARNFEAEFGGANRGRAKVLNYAADVTSIYPPVEKFDITELRMVPEMRIAAAYGLHSGSVGFLSGAKNNRVGATLIEMDRQSWRRGVLPVLNSIERALSMHLPRLIYGEGTRAKVKLSVSHIPDLLHRPKYCFA